MFGSKVFIAIFLAFAVVATAGASVALIAAKSDPKPIASGPAILQGSGSSNSDKTANKPTTTSTSIISTSTTIVQTQGNKTDESRKDFIISGSAPDLFPGATKQLPLTVSNPNNFAINVTSMTVTTSAASKAGCTTSSVSAGPFSGGLIVPKNADATTSVAIRMNTVAPNACQGATFTLVYSGIAEKA